jgi:RNA polymerase sigma factor (sigma-70 family)
MKTQKEKDLENGKIHAALIVLIQEGDKEAEGKLYIKCESKLYRVAFSLCREKQYAEDTLAKAWSDGMKEIKKGKDGKYIEQNSFINWLSTIIRNGFYHDKRDNPVFVKLESIAEITDTNDEDKEANEQKEEIYNELENELNKLSERKHTIYIMHFRLKDSYQVIATTFHVTKAYVRSEVAKIVKRLKRNLGHKK